MQDRNEGEIYLDDGYCSICEQEPAITLYNQGGYDSVSLCAEHCREGVEVLAPSALPANARHFFLDVEALGPPGAGDPFAFGLVEFVPPRPPDATDDSAERILGAVLSRRQWNLALGTFTSATGDTLAWIAGQALEVRAQLFEEPRRWPSEALAELVGALLDTPSRIELLGPRTLADVSGATLVAEVPTFLWADDWSDFAWLEQALRTYLSTSLRGAVTFVDSSFLALLRPPAEEPTHRNPAPHVAVHDAEAGARDLLARWREVFGV